MSSLGWTRSWPAGRMRASPTSSPRPARPRTHGPTRRSTPPWPVTRASATAPAARAPTPRCRARSRRRSPTPTPRCAPASPRGTAPTRSASGTCSSSAPPGAAPRRSSPSCSSGCATPPSRSASTPPPTSVRSPRCGWKGCCHDLVRHHPRARRRPRRPRRGRRRHPRAPGGRRLARRRHRCHQRRRPHPRPRPRCVAERHLPADLRRRRLLRRRRHRDVLPGGRRDLPDRRRAGALPRADPAQPVRLLHLPRELTPMSATTPSTEPYEIASEVAELGFNQYGKAENHLVHVRRDGDVHELTDFTVSSQLRGDFARVHTHGDNAHCVATDSQKNTIFSLARDGVSTPEEFAIRLSDHFTSTYAWVTGGRWQVDQRSWERIVTDDGPHDHSFVRGGEEVRRTVVQRDGDELFVVSGVVDLTV